MENTITFLDAIVDGVGTAVEIVGTVVTALVGSTGALTALLPVIGLSIGMGAVGYGIRTVKSLVWGF